jgi:hypothetical protein
LTLVTNTRSMMLGSIHDADRSGDNPRRRRRGVAERGSNLGASETPDGGFIAVRLLGRVSEREFAVP